MNYTDCPICSSSTTFLDVVDFNKSCEELNGKYLPLSGTPIYYRICDSCNFVFAPEIFSWDDGMFLEKIYNEDYIKVDPEYLIDRPRKTSEILLKKLKMFLLTKGSPPVILNLFIPISIKTEQTLSNSSNVNKSCLGKNCIFSDMQYTQRKSQRSVTETLRYVILRLKGSISGEYLVI